MANRLTMAQIDAIRTRHKSKHSNREIARLLGVHRETVGKYVGQDAQNRPNAPTGSEAGRDEHPPPPGSGPSSECEPFGELILAKLEQGLSAVRIHQDLCEEPGFAASYWSVRRFVARLKTKSQLPFRRLETLPGEEAQVDFGTGAPIHTPDGKRRPWVFRIVLSHSRKAYSEAVYRQTTEAFIQCLENAFRYFGGVTKHLVIDNLKAAVAKADWYDPEIHPKLQSFAAHYGTVFLPTKPYTPRHKGKVESSVKYVKGNALKGRVFTSLAEENEFLLDWEASIADTRIHGTTKLDGRCIATGMWRWTRPSIPRRRNTSAGVSGCVGTGDWSACSTTVGSRWPCMPRLSWAASARRPPAANRLDHAEFLELILQDELAVRRERLIARRTKAASFREQKTLEDFDWDELRSMIMTSNRPLEDWGKLIGDIPAATAILDRFLQHAEIIQITGKSYRLQRQPAQQKGETKEK